jgi:hypothetical protein
MPVTGDGSFPPPACGGADGSGGERAGRPNGRQSASAVADLVSGETRAPPAPSGHLPAPRTHPEVAVLALATHAMPALPPRVLARPAAHEVAAAVHSGALAPPADCSAVSPPRLMAETPCEREGSDNRARLSDAGPAESEPGRHREAPPTPHGPAGGEPIAGASRDGAAGVPLPPLGQQLHDAVQQSLAAPEARGPDWEPAAVPRGGAAKGETLRVLDVSLEPAELGSMRVRLALRDATLRVEIEAAMPETARLLADEQTQLGDRLQAAGYVLEAVVVSAAGDGPATPAGGHGRALPDPTGTPPGQGRLDTGSGRHGGGETPRGASQAARGAREAAPAAPDQALDGLYV